MSRTRVIKLGGELIDETLKLKQVARQIRVAAESRPVVVVHGGGQSVTQQAAKLGLKKQTVDGLRITDAETMEVVLGVLAGCVNTRLVATLTSMGLRAVGLTGADDSTVTVRRAQRYQSVDGDKIDLGFVGIPKGSDKTPKLLKNLAASGYIPVIASIGSNRKGELFNVNADTFSADLAVRLGASWLTIAGTTSGVLDRNGKTISSVDDKMLMQLIKNRQANAGMVAKLLACRTAKHGGVKRIEIVDGRSRNALNKTIGSNKTTIR
tara:strand:+ start:26779 stop:27576 length:798 start_codon:yes stop_codon:yes gene_type:complete